VTRTAPRADAGGARPALAEKVEAELEAWDLPGAGKALDELVRQHPHSAERRTSGGWILSSKGVRRRGQGVTPRPRARGGGKGAVRTDARLARARRRDQGPKVFAERERAVHRAHAARKGHPARALRARRAGKGVRRGLTKDLASSRRTEIRVEIYDSARSLAHVSPLTVEQIKNLGTIASASTAG